MTSALFLCNIHNAHESLKRGFFIHMQVQQGIRTAVQKRGELFLADDVVIMADAAVRPDADEQFARTFGQFLGHFGFRQHNVQHRTAERGGHDEKHQQHEHHVDERRQVYLRIREKVVIHAAFSSVRGRRALPAPGTVPAPGSCVPRLRYENS